MANEKKLKLNGFKFQPFSKKQLKVLSWAMEGSPTEDKYMLVADGSIRSGKSLTMSLAFVLWSMTNFNGMNFAITGKSSGAVRRNIIGTLKQMLLTLGYDFVDHRADNYLEITKGEVTNIYYIFGGKDESSQDLVQGLTLAGAFLDKLFCRAI